MKRLHIAHFTNTYFPVISGVVRSVSHFRRGLAELGHNVFVFAQHASNYEDETPFIFRYPALELPMQNYPLTIPVSTFVDKLLPSLKLDVIHAHHPALLGQVAANKAADFDIPLVFTHHTFYQEYSHYIALPQELVKDVIERWLADYMGQCQHIIVPSESIRRMLADTYGIVDRVTVLPTGIDTTPYETADPHTIRTQRNWGQQKVLISIGRLAEEKNWPTLLRAVHQVMAHRLDVRLVILGDGPSRESLQEMTETLGMADRVEFTGLLPFEMVPSYLKSADLFCFASVTETQGLVTLEALAAGLPVVAVDASGTRDVVENGREGLLTANDSTALAQAIEHLLDHEALYHQFQQNCQIRVRQFDLRSSCERLVTVYEQAIADKKAGFAVLHDQHKPVFSINWRKLLGLESELPS